MEVIGLDIDSVIGNTEFTLDNYFKKNYNIHIDWDKVTDYRLEKFPDIPKNIIDDTLKHIFEGDLLFDVLPYNYAEHAINKLYNEGFKVAIITSRPLNLQVKTVEWLEKYNLKYDFIYHVHSTEKYKIINALGVKSFVEDRSDIIDSVVNNCDCIEYGLYVVNHPWNRGYENRNLVRVNDVSEAVDKIIDYRKWRNFLIHRCQGDIKKFIKEYYDGKGTM